LATTKKGSIMNIIENSSVADEEKTSARGRGAFRYAAKRRTEEKAGIFVSSDKEDHFFRFKEERSRTQARVVFSRTSLSTNGIPIGGGGV